MLFIDNLSTFERLYCGGATLSGATVNEKMMNDAFAKKIIMRLYTLFLFFWQAKPHAAIDALFSALLPFGQPFYAGIGDEFCYRQMMNTTLYYWSRERCFFLS